tara:strand:+ start:8748 stop:8882 length:135 start_codon:yes stop_codon:yes gene_type:complete
MEVRIKITPESRTDFNETELTRDLYRKFAVMTGYEITELDIYEL